MAATITVSETEEAKELVAQTEAEAVAEREAQLSANSVSANSVSGNSVSANSVSCNSVSADKVKVETVDEILEKKASQAPTIEVAIASGNFDSDEDFSKLVIAQVTYYVNVRDIPSEDGEVVGKLYNHSAGEWLDKEGDWYKIKSGSVTGYVKGEFVVSGEAAVDLARKVGERVAVVTTTTLKVRESASLDSPVLGLVPMEDRLTVVEENDNWCKVSIEEGDGWVNKEYVKVSTEFPKAESKAEEEARIRKEEAARKAAIAAANRAASRGKGGKSGKGSKSGGGGGGSYAASGGGPGASVANYALQFVGNPYVYGGSSLTGGTDCSGFTMSVYRNFGVSLPHSSGAQRSMGYSVGGLANAQAGDIVCYSGHVGIYIGGGQIVHASTAKTGIKVSNAGYRNILDVRRIF
ncbi:MAG: SH3 domain-containing protein [Lachnospiraceae bacterium]|nr:SH3 domain-containing protein [Lachnospiraceae bacterium]